MTEAMDVKTLVVTLPNTASDFQADDVVMNIMKAPPASQGGGLTILEAWLVNQAATTSGTAFALTLQNYGTAGTAIKSTAGTVGATRGGTEDPFSAGVPYEFTLVNPILGADEWLVLRKDEDNSSDPTRCVVMINYVIGV